MNSNPMLSDAGGLIIVSWLLTKPAYDNMNSDLAEGIACLDYEKSTAKFKNKYSNIVL